MVGIEDGVRAELIARLRSAGSVFAEDEAAVLVESAGVGDELCAMVERRVAGEPLEHVVGWAEFCGLRIAVDPGVFVPRRRTEALARSAVARARPGDVVVDLCCGSGAIGAVVASAVRGVALHAVDVDPVAVRCARRNLAPSGGQVHAGDLFDPLPSELRAQVDVVVVNAPYVPTGEVPLMPAEARLHEPLAALDGGADGLDVHRRVAAAAGSWLADAGVLLTECSRRQQADLTEVYAAGGLSGKTVLVEDATAVVALTAARCAAT
ncbi:MAG TPA: putative protein N(5)-glutamine methyltransferase [Mycobacteriales bacterium]|nr:putative protein N(5)-glutamine methyltransferase [Mycobacteriales bacterium]